jgi:hypothetical protein
MRAGAQGGCGCGQVRYRLEDEPMVVHCCHCRWCQRETGTAFALNAFIESDRVTLLCGEPETIDTPSASGKGQLIVRCASCKVAVWSHYAGLGAMASYVRVGTLDNPDACPPDVHIFTESKQPWVILPEGAEQYSVFYSRTDIARIYGERGAERLRTVRES